jgi:hypothetical protein
MATRRWDEVRPELIARWAAQTGETTEAIEAHIAEATDELRLAITAQEITDERDLAAWDAELEEP